MNTRVEVKSYSILRNNHCINRWVKYFYECELFKKSLKSHQLDPKTDRHKLTDLGDQQLFEQKRKLLYAKFIEGLQAEYGIRKTQRMKAKIVKLSLKRLKGMYLLTQNTKIYRYSHRFKTGSGYKPEVYDVNT